MAGLADMFLQKAMTPQNTGYMNAYNQGEQQAYGRGLSGALASGAPGEEVMSKASYVDPMGVLKMNESRTNSEVSNANSTSQDPTLLKNVNQLGVQYRSYLNARYSKQYNEMTPQAQQGLNQSINGIKQIMSKSELGRAMLGEAEQEIAPNLGATDTVNTATQVDNELIKNEASELSQQLKDGAVDDDNNGLIDDIVGLSALVRSFGTKYGNATEAKGLSDLLDDLKENVANKFKASTEQQKISHRQGLDHKRLTQSSKRDKIAEDVKFNQSWNAKAKLLKDPTITNIRAAINVTLRDESGAAIGADEFSNMMSFVLPDEAYNQFKGDTQGLGNTLLGMVSDVAREDHMKRVAEDYLRFVDPQKLHDYMDDRISPQYYRRSEQSPKKGRFSKF